MNTTDKLGLAIQISRAHYDKLKKYLKENNVSGYSSDGSLIEGKATYSTEIISEILGTMIRSSYIFEFECMPNLLEHIKARKNIIKLAESKKYYFGAGKDFKAVSNNPNVLSYPSQIKNHEYYYNNPSESFAALNHSKTQIACWFATKLTMLAGGGQYVRRHLDIWIPGDWGYIKNMKYHNLGKNYEERSKIWLNSAKGGSPDNAGYEGENIIYVGHGKWWGHISSKNTIKSLTTWQQDMKKWKTTFGGATPSVMGTVDFTSRGLKSVRKSEE